MVLVPLGAAHANTVYVEDFSPATFQGATTIIGIGNSDATSDKYDPTYYYTINSAAGWSFSGQTALLAVGGREAMALCF